MRSTTRCLLILISLQLCTWHLIAQEDIIKKLADKIDHYSLLQPSATFFVHFDKNIYTPNENVWFTGYLLKHTDSLAEDNAMSMAVVRDADRSVLSSGKFVMKDGISFGNVFLPDSMPTGNYTFIVYTNLLINGDPAHVFMQPVTIKAADTRLVANMRLLDSIEHTTDSVRVLLNVRTTDITLIAKAPVSYWLGESSPPVFSGKELTDRKGELIIKLPADKITQQNFILTAQVQYEKETKTLRMRLPVYQRKPSVKFYPEGGTMVTGLNNLVGCEIKTPEGEPLLLDAVLYEDWEPIRYFKTNTYGLGRLSFIPYEQHTYEVRLQTGSDTISRYRLPAIAHSGPVLHVPSALCSDTLDIWLKTSYAGHFVAMVHNYQQAFLATTVDLEANINRKLRFALNDVPRGLAEITITDSAGNPLLTRIFFAHNDKKPDLAIAIDSVEYHKRAKVEVTIQLRTKNDTSVTGLVSIACVQDNRIDVRKMKDIESYVYLTSELSQFPFRHKPLSGEDDSKEYLEDILLIKGWRKNKWDAFNDTAKKTDKQSLAYKGYVLPRQKKKQAPFHIVFFRDNLMSMLDTDSLGNFQLSDDEAISSGTKNVMYITGIAGSTHKIEIADPYDNLNAHLAKRIEVINDATNSLVQTTQTLALAKDEFTHLLPTVTINSSKNDGSVFRSYKGNCADYVCMFNVLNCSNHPFGGAKPVKGKTYMYMYKTVVYTSDCDDVHELSAMVFNGIKSSKEFYVSDYAAFNPPDPELVSTLYWKHLVPIQKGVAKISFYTGDITGKFRIVVQGVTSNDNVMYADHLFTVTP